jgi:hypothetical protein
VEHVGEEGRFSMMTDIPAALRSEIEAVEDAYEKHFDNLQSDEAYQAWLAARAALCAKVEKLMLSVGPHECVYCDGEFAIEARVHALLNEEPKDGDDKRPSTTTMTDSWGTIKWAVMFNDQRPPWWRRLWLWCRWRRHEPIVAYWSLEADAAELLPEE